MSQPLSPAAQAVLDAPTRAAALRALADQVVPDDLGSHDCFLWKLNSFRVLVSIRESIRAKILAIAAELEGG